MAHASAISCCVAAGLTNDMTEGEMEALNLIHFLKKNETYLYTFESRCIYKIFKYLIKVGNTKFTDETLSDVVVYNCYY